MAETYKLELHANGPWVGCESTDVVPLSDYGCTDEEWDALTSDEQYQLLDEWGQEYFWNEGYEYSSEVIK